MGLERSFSIFNYRVFCLETRNRWMDLWKLGSWIYICI